MYDIIIVGSGPAGLTAAIYALRADKSVLVLEKETFGGQITLSPHVENCPGFPHISGSELGEKLLDQAMGLGAEIDMGEVTGIRRKGETCIVETSEGNEYAARAVILATGSRHRPLGVLTGEKRLADKLYAKDNVSFIYNSVVTALEGERELSSIVIKNTETGESTRLPFDGVFVCIGQIPENEPFREHVALNDYGYFEAGEDCLTRDPAIFVAGDCRSKRIRQIPTATADGAVAAIAACRYLDK